MFLRSAYLGQSRSAWKTAKQGRPLRGKLNEPTIDVHKKHLTALLQSLLKLKNIKKKPSKSIYARPLDGNKERKAFISVLKHMKIDLIGRRTFKVINDSLLRPMPAFYRQYIQHTNQKIIANMRKMAIPRCN